MKYIIHDQTIAGTVIDIFTSLTEATEESDRRWWSMSEADRESRIYYCVAACTTTLEGDVILPGTVICEYT